MPLPAARTAEAVPDPGRLRPPLLSPPASRTRELTAALAIAVLLLHVLFAPVTLILAGVLLVIGRLGRWRPLWLAGPAAAGIGWITAAGPGPAAAGFAAGPRQVGAFCAGVIGHPGRLGQAAAAFAGAGHWLPRQLPVALALAAAEAALAAHLLRARAAGPPAWRPGLVITIRRRRAAAALAAGQVVTRDGTGIGLDDSAGRRAEISWAAAAGGVLAVGADPQAAARASFPVAAAAIRRRMTVVVVDFTGSSWLADALSGACASAAAPLGRFSPAGPAWYEPFRSHPPPGAAALAIKMISWAGTTEGQRRAGQRYLADMFAVLAARPAPVAVLDALIALLEPARLRDALAVVPGHLPQRDALALRVAGSAAALEADPALGQALAGQLRRLRASAPGRWLRPPPPPPPAAPAPPGPARPPPGASPHGPAATRPAEAIRLGQAVRERSCVLFSPGPGGAAAAMAGRLAVADLTTVLSELRDQGLRGDCLAWVHGCEAVDRPSLAALLALGPATSTAVLLSTASPAAAASLAPAAGLVVPSGPVDPVLAGRLAALAGIRDDDGERAAAQALRAQQEDEFAIITRGAGFRPGCRSVPAAWARRR
ncbi:MAG TPA: hypothetical protein VGH88_24510 [Streptosporangiaceae bacterium]|jgi:hypothetical protein